jgi:RNA polymerase sigma-70 factor (ECF subfamily)
VCFHATDGILRQGTDLKAGTRGYGGIEGDENARAAFRVRPEFTSFDEMLTFDQQVAAIEPELRRFVARKVSPVAVDDVLQEVWLAAWQNLPKYNRQSKFRTWIYAICVNKCHDHHRMRHWEHRLVPLDAEPLLDGTPSPEDTVTQNDAVRRLLAGLDETQREVIELYYYAQLTLSEIAAILDRNLNTVKYQFYRAHSELLAASGKEGFR